MRSDEELDAAAAECLRFLQALWPEPVEGTLQACADAEAPGSFEKWQEWHLGDGDTVEIASSQMVARSERYGNVWIGVGAQAGYLGSGKRGSASTVAWLPGAWLDLDVGADGHSAAGFATYNEAYALVEALGLPPSIVVRSGGGLQVYWLYTEALGDREMGWRICDGLRVLASRATSVKLDNVSDLARVLRPPGTLNWKLRPVTRPVVLERLDTDVRYRAEDLGRYLGQYAGQVPDLNGGGGGGGGSIVPAKLDVVLGGCAWMRHCRDDAQGLGEPEWYASLSILGRCDEDGAAAAHEWGSSHPGYSRGDTDRKLAHAVTASGPRTCDGVRAVAGDRWCEGCSHRATGGRSPVTITGKTGMREPGWDFSRGACTDAGNAIRLVDAFEDRLMRCRGAWWLWDERLGVWMQEKDKLAQGLAAQLSRLIVEEAEQTADLATAGRLRAWALRTDNGRGWSTALEKAALYLQVPDGVLDQAAWRINTPGGMLDMLDETGELKPHDRLDYITKVTPVTPAPVGSAVGERWQRYLEHSLPDVEVREYVQRALGRSLCGDVSEKTVFMICGEADTGKSTLMETVMGVVGLSVPSVPECNGYMGTIPVETIIKSGHASESHERIMAGMQGSRLVVASESEEDAKLSASGVKKIVGGETVAARLLYREMFAFKLEAVLWTTSNHFPRVGEMDDSIWKKLQPIPFDNVWLPGEAVGMRTVVDTLVRKEGPSILRWLLDGVLDWQRRGGRLDPPASVQAMKADKRQEQDLVMQFLEEACMFVPPRSEGSPGAPGALMRDLYGAYRNWMIGRGFNRIPTQNRLTRELKKRHFENKRYQTGDTTQWLGIELRAGWAPTTALGMEGHREA